MTQKQVNKSACLLCGLAVLCVSSESQSETSYRLLTVGLNLTFRHVSTLQFILRTSPAFLMESIVDKLLAHHMWKLLTALILLLACQIYFFTKLDLQQSPQNFASLFLSATQLSVLNFIGSPQIPFSPFHTMSETVNSSSPASLNTTRIVKVDGKSHLLLDEEGRRRLFRGVNVVFKKHPYHPSLDRFDPFTSFTDEVGIAV